MEYILSIFSGGISGAALIWITKGWISERLRQSIQHEYSEKLESYKTELNSKIEAIKHENQLSQLRTSLFFDHQRDAFAALISKIAQINTEWAIYNDIDEGLYEPPPSERIKEFENLIHQHQLFLDEECLMVLSLVSGAYFRSLPYDNRSGAPPHQNENSQHFSFIEYIQPRLASIFRAKIGIITNPQHLIDISTLSAIELVNEYHFPDVGIPPKGALCTKRIKSASDQVSIGLENIDELVVLLRNFDKYLSSDGGWIHEAQLKVKRTLNVLEKCRKNLQPL